MRYLIGWVMFTVLSYESGPSAHYETADRELETELSAAGGI